jgi:peroxiredoxin
MKKILSACSLIIAIIFSATALAEVKPGQKAPVFTGTTTSGEPISLENFKGKFVVLEWFNPGCPFTGKHYKSNNMQTLQKNYTSKNVVWVSINSGSGDASKKINDWATSVSAAASYYISDKGSAIASLYEAKATPHMFVIDPNGILIYAGAIDDKRSTDVEDIVSAKNYVSSALDQALAGKEVETKSTKPYGCPVKF